MSLPAGKIKELQKLNPGYVKTKLPAGTYAGQKEAVLGIGTPTIIICRADMPADEVYWITKKVAENVETLRAAHSAMRKLTVRALSEVSGIQMHPGAARYYKEVLK